MQNRNFWEDSVKIQKSFLIQCYWKMYARIVASTHLMKKYRGVIKNQIDVPTTSLFIITMSSKSDKNMRQLLVTAFLNGPVSNEALITRTHLSECTICQYWLNFKWYETLYPSRKKQGCCSKMTPDMKQVG